MGELLHRVLHPLVPPVNDVDAIRVRVCDVALHERSEPTEVGCYRGDTHHRALRWCVAPGLIVGGENTKMAPSNKLAVVHAKQGISRGEELGMKDNLDPVLPMVVQVHPADVAEDRVISVVNDIVGDHSRELNTLGGKDTSLEHDNVIVVKELTLVWYVAPSNHRAEHQM